MDNLREVFALRPTPYFDVIAPIAHAIAASSAGSRPANNAARVSGTTRSGMTPAPSNGLPTGFRKSAVNHCHV